MSAETNQERLKWLKQVYGTLQHYEAERACIRMPHFSWLIERAEHTQSVEEENARQKKMLLHLYRYMGMSAEYDAKLWKELETFLGGRGAARKALEGEG